MDLTFTQAEEEFRSRFRAWLDDNVGAWRRENPEVDGHGEAALRARLRWEQKVFDAGWAGPAWPVDFGGLGLTVMEQLIYYEEMARADAPEEVNRGGIRILGPTLIDAGTEEQKQRYLPGILQGREVWCQGFSEPGAGSDLAAVRTLAVPSDDGGFVVTGQKVWTTNAHVADHMFALVRTDPDAPLHRGISYLIIDMKAPGVTVRPIRDLTGDSEFNEVFLDQVYVPSSGLIGELHAGWALARRTLGYERTLNIASRIVRVERQVDAMADLARRGGLSLEPDFRRHVARSFVDARVMRLAAYRSVTGDGDPAVLGAMLKLHWSEAHQEMLEGLMRALGTAGQLAEVPGQGDVWTDLWLTTHSETIYAGTSEILRNVVAERGLGLPRAAR